MQIESVTLSSFRPFGPDPISVKLSSEITAIVGPNGAGKTAFLHALIKLFGVSRAQRVWHHGSSMVRKVAKSFAEQDRR